MKLPVLDSTLDYRSFTPIPVFRATDAVPLPIENSLLSESIDFTPSNKQPGCWRGPGFRQQAGSGGGYCFTQMSEYLLTNCWVFNAGNYLDETGTFATFIGLLEGLLMAEAV